MKNRKRIIALLVLMILTCSMTSCAWLDSKIQDIKGSLIGDSYTIEFYDNYGAKFLTSKGERIDLEGNYVEVYSSDGTSAYELSSVVTITIDGQNMETTGSTVIFEGKGVKKLADFSLTDTNSEAESILDITSVARNVNDFKNKFGVSKVVVIQSQMGVPICAYGGENVYWEIPEDLPKTTKLMIDGKPLYIHRANYVMLDTELLDK